MKTKKQQIAHKRIAAALRSPEPPTARAPKLAAKKPSRNTRLGRGANPARVRAILEKLDEAYPAVTCALVHENPFQLLISTILSAQCTDVRVNMVTPELFRQFPTPKAMSEASQPALEELIRSTGFYRNKAKSILGAAKKIATEFGGKVPRTLAELTTVPGAARKTANVVLGVAYGLAEGVVVDTHVLRISHRLHLTQATEPKQVEQDLMKIIPKDHWIAYSHEIIHHGRQICIARKPKCADCTLETVCTSGDKTWSSGKTWPND
jgi:endonuclease-3